MELSFWTEGRQVPYTVRRSVRAKRLRLAVYPDGRVVASVPLRVSELQVRRFVETQHEWIAQQLARINTRPKPAWARMGRQEYLQYKESARALAHARLAHFNEQYGFKYGRVSIKDHASRWGSCSAKKNLNFNFRILFLPPPLRDYVIVHELCHLQELNHSMSFWKLVARAVPDYRRARAELRKYSLGIQ